MDSFEQENRSLKRTLHVLISKAERNQEILRTFQQIELQLLSCNRLGDLLDMLLINIKEYFSLDGISLFLFDPEGTAQALLENYNSPSQQQWLSFHHNYPELRQLYPKNIDKPILLEPDAELKKCLFPNERAIESCAMLPLERHGFLIGSLHLGSRDPSRYTERVATDYISHMASIISVCIENAISQETLHKLSIIDMLTKVNNRRSFDQELMRELSRASRNQYAISCLFVDLDHFKKINDSYGHQTGDKVLAESAQVIKSQLRSTDFMARYGGEEFAILLPGCDAPRAIQVAENVRTAVRRLTFYSEEQQPFKVTLSVGVACSNPSPHPDCDLLNDAHQLVANADKGVYKAKESGRDCVIYVPSESIRMTAHSDMDADLLETFSTEPKR